MNRRMSFGMCVLCYRCIALHPHSTTCKFAARRMTMYRAARKFPDLLCALQTYKITCGRRRMVDSLPARKLCTGLREPPRGICALRMYRELMLHANDLQPLRKLCTEVRERPQSFLPRCVCIARRPITITCKRHPMGTRRLADNYVQNFAQGPQSDFNPAWQYRRP